MTRFTRLLFLIVAVAFAIRIGYVAGAKDGPCVVRLPDGATVTVPSECAVGDQLFYNAEANTVAEGRGFTEPYAGLMGMRSGPAADHPPLTVLVLAPVSWLAERPPLQWIAGDPTGSHLREHRFTMAILGTLNVALVGFLGRRVGRRRSDSGAAVGLVAAAIVAVAPFVWVNDGLVMSETVSIMTALAAIRLAFAAHDRRTPLRLAALGAACGLATLARAELVLLFPLLVGPVVWRAPGIRARGTGLLAAAAATVVVLTPWVGFNLVRFDERTFVSTNDGIALLGSYCDAVFSGPAVGLTAIEGPASCLPPFPPGDQSVVAAEFRAQALDYAAANPRRLPAVAAARIGRTWGLFRPGDMISYNTGEGREEWVTRLGYGVYYPTLVAAIAGVAVLVRRRQRFAIAVLLAPVVAATVGAALTYGQTRFRATAEPALAILAAVAIVALVRRFRSTPAPGP